MKIALNNYLLQHRKVSQIGDRNHDAFTPSDECAQASQHLTRINKMLKHIVDRDTVEAVARQIGNTVLNPSL